jgi:DNA helicase-2/ATP-dependent DNA helicase PcrA
VQLTEGIISHDQILKLGEDMFEKYELLCRIVVNKYPFIFVDEFQDTHKEMARILFKHLQKLEHKKTIVGLFGDEMQQIYDSGIGDLKSFMLSENIVANNIEYIDKTANRRNPEQVIKLANTLRDDGLKQTASQDHNAPNMDNGVIKNGQITFIYSDHQAENTTQLKQLKDKLVKNYGWNFDNDYESKELYLTHKIIASHAEFKKLMEIYSEDKILEYVRSIKRHIESNNISVDVSNDVGEILKQLSQADQLKSPTKSIETFINDNLNLYNYALSCQYSH